MSDFGFTEYDLKKAEEFNRALCEFSSGDFKQAIVCLAMQLSKMEEDCRHHEKMHDFWYGRCMDLQKELDDYKKTQPDSETPCKA